MVFQEIRDFQCIRVLRGRMKGMTGRFCNWFGSKPLRLKSGFGLSKMHRLEMVTVVATALIIVSDADNTRL